MPCKGAIVLEQSSCSGSGERWISKMIYHCYCCYIYLLSAHYVWDNILSLFYRESYSIFVKTQWVETHFTSEGTCLSSFRMLWQNTRNWVTCKQWTFISHNPGGGAGLKSGCQHGWVRSLFPVANFFSLYPHMAGGGSFRDSVKSWKPLEKGPVWLDLGFRIMGEQLEIMSSNKKVIEVYYPINSFQKYFDSQLYILIVSNLCVVTVSIINSILQIRTIKLNLK